MEFFRNDGGRAAAGFPIRKHPRDCVCRAIAIATGVPYAEVHVGLAELAKKERTGRRKKGKSNPENGVYTATATKYLRQLGWVWQPLLQIGATTRFKVEKLVKIPDRRVIIRVRKHFFAMVDKVIQDVAPVRESRVVLGYYRPITVVGI